MTIKSFYKPTPQLDAANLVINFQITNVRRGNYFLKNTFCRALCDSGRWKQCPAATDFCR